MAATASWIREQVARFERWHYEFDLGGVRTPIFDPDHVNRHRQRASYFFDPLVSLCGGSLAGKRVLDLGSNAGFWSLKALQAGCERVLAIDGRAAHVEQARLVFEATGVSPERYRLVEGNFFEVDFAAEGPFDIVLALGVFYHVAKPFELLERISRANRDLLVIDTNLCRGRGAALQVIHEPTEEPRNSVEHRLVMWPTLAALLAMMEEVGYRTCPLEPRFSDYRGAEDYRRGLRRAVIGARESGLEPLEGLREKLGARGECVVPTDLSAESFGALARAMARKALRSLGPRAGA